MEVVELDKVPTHHINYRGSFDAEIVISSLELQAANTGNTDAQKLICANAYAALSTSYKQAFTEKYHDVTWGPNLKINVIREPKTPVKASAGRHVR
jgi:hypothetical protein